jgi:hypothetical protein
MDRSLICGKTRSILITGGTNLLTKTHFGPFKLDPTGLLSPMSPASFPRFYVSWRKRLVQARMRQEDTDDSTEGTLELATSVGRVPSTGKPPGDPPKRDAALAMLRQLPALLPAGWRLTLAADHSVLIQTEVVIVLPISAISLVTQMSLFLLSLGPYLDALDEGGMGFMAGTAKT